MNKSTETDEKILFFFTYFAIIIIDYRNKSKRKCYAFGNLMTKLDVTTRSFIVLSISEINVALS